MKKSFDREAARERGRENDLGRVSQAEALELSWSSAHSCDSFRSFRSNALLRVCSLCVCLSINISDSKAFLADNLYVRAIIHMRGSEGDLWEPYNHTCCLSYIIAATAYSRANGRLKWKYTYGFAPRTFFSKAQKQRRFHANADRLTLKRKVCK